MWASKTSLFITRVSVPTPWKPAGSSFVGAKEETHVLPCVSRWLPMLCPPFPGSAQQRRVSLCHAPHSARFLTAVSQACSSDGPKPLRDHVIGLGSPVPSRSPPYFKFCHLNPTRKTPFALKRHIVTGLGDHGEHVGVGEAVCLQRVRGRVYGS